MVNLYAYTYPSAMAKYDGYILTKVGDSTRDVDIRIDEQGGAAEYEKKINVHAWNKLTKIKRDHDVHRELDKLGLHHKDGKGTEWFKIPAETLDDVVAFLDIIVQRLEGKKVRNKVILRGLQQQKLDEAMAIIESGEATASIIANLCPRFGKTIWALSLFNEISKKYGNRVMLLPAYWLSVHSSFAGELDLFDDYLDIVEVKTEEEYMAAIENGKRVLVPVSLHGDLAAWQEKHEWISNIDNNEIFVFADEGDFGTHADNQVEKMNYLFAN